ECHQDLADGAKFCSKCGAEVKEQKNHCKKCNHELKKDDEFCENCGEKVHKEKFLQESEKRQMENSPSVFSKKKKNKGVITTIAGVVVLAVIVFLVFNMKDNKDEDSIDDYSLEGLADHYGIDEELLTFDEMSEAVNQIEVDYEDDLKDLNNEDRSLFIEEIIEEDYGEYNANAYSSGLLIDEDMSKSDRQQVIAALLGEYTYKNISNPIDGTHDLESKNEPITKWDILSILTQSDTVIDTLVGDTNGLYEYGNVRYGYPTVLGVAHKDTLGIDIKTYGDDEYVAYIGITGMSTKDMTIEEAIKEKLKQYDIEINERKYEEYFTEELLEEGTNYNEGTGEETYTDDMSYIKLIPKNTIENFDIYVALPVKEVFEDETGTGEEIAIKYNEGELKKGKINLWGEDIELSIYESGDINIELVE